MASSGVGALSSLASTLSELQAITAFTLTELSVASEFSSLGSLFGPAFSLGFGTQPTEVIIYNQSGQTSNTGGDSLKDSANHYVPIGTAIDQNGNTVATADLETAGGAIVAFQSAPPTGLDLTSAPPSNASPVATIPSLKDANGGAVIAGAMYDQYGGTVLTISLTGANGKATTFYSEVDSLGNAVDATTQSNQNTQFTDLDGVNIPITAYTDQFGNPIEVATLTNSLGQVEYYETESPSVDQISQLSTTNPVGPQNAQPGPFDSQGNQIANLTMYTPAGNIVDNITLYNGFGVGTQFYSEFDSAGNATQAITLTATPPATVKRLTAFGSNPSLVTPSVGTVPSSITPFTATSPGVLSTNETLSSLQDFTLFDSFGTNPFSLLSLFLPTSSFPINGFSFLI